MPLRLVPAAVAMMLWPALALAQQTPAQPAPADAPVPELMFFTLGAALIIAVGALL